MRIHVNKNPAIGSRKVMKGFLFFPKFINREWRWLEYAYWEQTYHSYRCGWRNSWWLSKEEYIARKNT